MATGLGTTMSPLPQGPLATYIVQGDDDPLATKGNRVAYVVQGNDKPLPTNTNWAVTYNDCKEAKAPAVKLIVPIVIPLHCNEAL
jgi:hypothetical protein